MIRKSHGVALAALALASSAAFAQSSVKIYGLLDVSFGAVKTAHTEGSSQPSTSVNSGQMTTSFIGFAGAEDLGGGLKAEFALESFLAADNGTTLANNGGGFWGRASWVGLSGSFGKVTIGQYDNPLFTFGYTYNPFGSSMQFSPTMRHYNYIGQTGTGVGFDTGWINSLTYESPNMGGFTFVGQFSTKETTLRDSKNSYTLAANYNAGPLSLGAVFVKAGASNNLSGSWNHDENVWALGASYDFGVVKPFLQYTQIKIKKELIAATTLTPAFIADFGGNDVKDRVMQAGVTVPVSSAGAILASYGEAKIKIDGVNGTAKDKVFSLGYDHNLSKRTDVYVVYSYNKRSASNATLNDEIFSNGTNADWESGNSFVVGLRHNF